MSTETTPADRVIAILEEELPGFKAQIKSNVDQIRWRGPFWLAGYVGMDAIMAVPEAAEAQMAREIVERTRRQGIEALGLQAEIDRRVEWARAQGRQEGFAEGKVAGVTEGRREMLAEILAATTEADDDPRD